MNIENIKIVACDVDSTLITPGKERLSERLCADFHKLIEKDIMVFINTGRHYTFIQPSLFEDLPMDYIGTINGGCLTRRDGSVIEKHPMSLKTMNDIIQLSQRLDIGLGFKFEDAVVTYYNHDKFVKGYTGTNKREAALVINDCEKNTHHLTYGLPLGTFFICEEEQLRPHLHEIPELTIAWSHRQGFDAFVKSVNKAVSVEAVLREKGWTWDNVLAFGDAGNDTPFIEKAAIGVVVANAKDDVKQVADIIADTCENDGVAKMLEELGLV